MTYLRSFCVNFRYDLEAYGIFSRGGIVRLGDLTSNLNASKNDSEANFSSNQEKVDTCETGRADYRDRKSSGTKI